VNEDSKVGTEVRGAALRREQRRRCLDHAGNLIAAAERVLADDDAYPNIAYHLAILAIEEIGKAGMLASCAVIGAALDGERLQKRLDDHVYKLMWAVWSPSMSGGKIDPKDFEDARQFAESTHARRKAGLYVDHSEDDTLAAPSEAVLLGHARSLLNLAKSRLELERYAETPIPDKRNEELEWYLETLGDELGKKRLFSQRFVQNLEEFGGDLRAWVSWAREKFAKIAAEEQEHLQRELSRQASDKSGRPKWIMKVRLQTPSHSLRQKALNFWNDRIDVVKLYHVGNKKNELLLEMTIYDNVTLDQLFDAGMSLSKTYITMLSIGTAGFFWHELSGQAQTYYESIRDLDAPHLEPRIRRVIGLAGQWAEDGPERSKRRRVALEEAHLNVVMMCLAAFSRIPDAEAAPIFGEYLKGLMLLSKNDLHLSVAKEARDFFLKTLRRAMQHFGDLSDVDADLSSALHRVMAPIIAEEDHRNQLFDSLDRQPPTEEGWLSAAVSAKRVADLYLAIVAKRFWSEFVQRSERVGGDG
jgi:AbiV family abortive infection protein